jgi:flagellar export protein FliJ
MANPKSLKTLLKLRKQELDQLRSRMQVLETQREQFMTKLVELQHTKEREAQLVSQNALMQMDYPRYVQQNMAEQKQYSQAIVRLSNQINELQGMMAVQFGEVKKTEILMEKEKQRAKETEEHRDRERMDELGQQFGEE